MFNMCCVPGCGSRRGSVKLFKFRKTEIGLQNWHKCLPSEAFGEVRNLSYSVFRNLYVCEKHFEKRFISCAGSKPYLRVDAYPSLFTDIEIASGLPRSPLNETRSYSQADHNYCKVQHCDHNYCKDDTGNSGASLSGSTLNPAPSSSSLLHQTTGLYEMDIDVQPSTSGLSTTPDEGLSKTDNAESKLLSTPKRKTRSHLVHSTQSLTPNCKKLYGEYKRSRKQLDFHKRAKKALKFSKDKSFLEITKDINPLAKKILFMQIRQCKKKEKGRRFTDEEKLVSLCIFKQSPKCYRFLQKIFILPSKQTLNKFTAALNIETGVNSQIFNAIKQEVNTWIENKKYCSILFDEVALEPGVTYDKNKDCIDGFVELDHKTNEFADHALVFMLRGALHRWQQPITFYFCKGATSSEKLKVIIKTVVAAVIETGLVPVALVSDQGTAFQSALKMLQEETRMEQIRSGQETDDGVILINNIKLHVIFDPPHLLKGLRNNFLTKNIKFKGKICKWSDIVDVYKTDCNHAQMRLLHKLNDEHVIPEKIKKMKVKNCTRVFSKTMAATLSYTAQFAKYANGEEVSGTIKNTAEVISFFDDLFDSVNGSSCNHKKNKGKALRNAVTKTSQHHQFWRQAISELEKLKFVDNSGKETSVPSVKNFIVTLKSYQKLWQFFEAKGIKIMRPRYFNSDPIENFFGQVRAYNFRNNSPDCHMFKCTFKTLLITRLIQFHSNTFNCEEDSGELLLRFQALFSQSPSQTAEQSQRCHNILVSPESSEEFSTLASQERLNVHSQVYTTGWVVTKVTKLFKNGGCLKCKENLLSKEKESIHKWISFREYKSVNQNKLTYPSEQAARLFRNITKEANEYLENQPQNDKILKKIKEIIKSRHSFDFLACEAHKNVAEVFVEITLKLTIFNWCTSINKIIKGTDVFRLENKRLPLMQQKAYNKFKTRLKKNKNVKN